MKLMHERDGSKVKNTCWSSRGPGINSQGLHGGTLIVILVNYLLGIYVYLHRPELLSALVRAASPCSGQQSVDRQRTVKVLRIRR